MTTTQAEAPTVINAIDGHPVAGGPAAVIEAALRGQAPLTITGKVMAGDVVWLRGREVWAEGATRIEHIARTVDHPVHGSVVYAWVDTRPGHLDQAPALRAKLDAQHHAATATEARGEAMVPGCDNCGDCPKCI